MTLLFTGSWLTTLPMDVRAGILLAELREREFTQSELAHAAGVSISIVQKVEAGKPVTGKTMGKILRAISTKTPVNPGDFASLIRPRVKRTAFASAEKFLAARGERVPAPGERNALLATERKQPEDELEITLGVAACHWVPCDETGEFINGRPVHGRFSIVIAGDCMEGDWKDGERVTFELLDKGDSEFVVDEDYLIIRDGHATFKRCAKVGENEIVLKAANGKYRDTWKVLRAEIQRAAIARYAHVNRRKGK